MRIARILGASGPQLARVDPDADRLYPYDPALGDDPFALDEAAAPGAPVALASVRLLCPLPRVRAIYGVGLNYRDHARELGKPIPETPPVFLKAPGALTGPFAEVRAPAFDASLDYEGELGVVLGARLHRADPAEARVAIFGYVVANDLTIRSLARPETLALAKGFAGACPIGPWITRAGAVPDPQALALTTTVNGALRQDSSTAEMALGVVDLLVHLARTLTLDPGDLVLTGSPHGSGGGFAPPRWLAPGDVVRVRIEGLGAIETRIAETA